MSIKSTVQSAANTQTIATTRIDNRGENEMAPNGGSVLVKLVGWILLQEHLATKEDEPKRVRVRVSNASTARTY